MTRKSAYYRKEKSKRARTMMLVGVVASTTVLTQGMAVTGIKAATVQESTEQTTVIEQESVKQTTAAQESGEKTSTEQDLMEQTVNDETDQSETHAGQTDGTQSTSILSSGVSDNAVTSQNGPDNNAKSESHAIEDLELTDAVNAPASQDITVTDQLVQANDTENTVSQIPGTVSQRASYNQSYLSVTGFASLDGNIHDRSAYVGTDAYKTVSDERDFLDALLDAAQGNVKVIEITRDMNLGYQELNLSKEEQKKYGSILAKYGNPSNTLTKVNGGFTNPILLESGVSKLSISNTSGLTIFSTNGSSIKHVEIKLNSSSSDIVMRNLSFKDMWQWDDTGKQKEVGWSNLKINGASNIWIDHCSFENAADGNIDIENGSSGVTISWCKIGVEATEHPDQSSSIYQSVMFMEDRYQNGLLADDSLYLKYRQAGATPEQLMAYSAYHKKCHLVGSGDKDYVDYQYSDGRILKDANSNLQLTMAYDYYLDVGQRVPMIRQGVGNLINCYIDNSSHNAALQANPIFLENGAYSYSRCINSRNGASIAADTCVFNGVEEPIVGSEIQGNDLTNMNSPWGHLFQKVYNHSLIVNSRVTNSDGTYVGSSWDNNGENAFTKGFEWIDKSTIGKWAWSSSIVGKENYSKSNPPTEEDPPFDFTYDYDGQLPYSYQVLPLEDVESVVMGKSGAGVISMSAKDWLALEYKAEPQSDPQQQTKEDQTQETKEDQTEAQKATEVSVENSAGNEGQVPNDTNVQESTAPKTADTTNTGLFGILAGLSALVGTVGITGDHKSKKKK